jgi:hypothetical protein
MKHTFIASLVLLALAGAASAADIAGIAWTESNLPILRSFNKADVAKFVDSGLVKTVGSASGGDKTLPGDIQEFTWADLAGDHNYELVTVLKSYTKNSANAMGIYHREPSGKIGEWWFQGMNIQLNGWPPPSFIPKAIQDLSGNGKKEIIIPSELGKVVGARPRFTWPKIYQQKNWRFADVSRNFPSFYDKQILPEYEREIAQTRKDVAETSGKSSQKAQDRLASLIMARDKVLRVIGRDPKAGEQQALEWIHGPNPRPLDAIIVLRDMGGHQAELKAAVDEMRQDSDAALKKLEAHKAEGEKQQAAKRAAAEKKLGVTEGNYDRP